eukprot:TRINITY_DN7901_c0_g1_i1.p1 TRINITY_DN7901_c0_g1~~TRINITY_DN7901_c0_g1_i1.p1  ORF type:complete len:224 (-),score=64.03 TRINITY_DN7901_c0_g1_i1:71-742(-)
MKVPGMPGKEDERPKSLHKPFVMAQMLMGRTWSKDCFGRVQKIVYLDDNIEESKGEERVVTIALEKEGSGLQKEHFETILELASDAAGCVCVFDFDCTLSSHHMYKAMHFEKSTARKHWNEHVESKFGASPLPEGWIPPKPKVKEQQARESPRVPSRRQSPAASVTPGEASPSRDFLKSLSAQSPETAAEFVGHVQQLKNTGGACSSWRHTDDGFRSSEESRR